MPKESFKFSFGSGKSVLIHLDFKQLQAIVLLAKFFKH